MEIHCLTLDNSTTNKCVSRPNRFFKDLLLKYIYYILIFILFAVTEHVNFLRKVCNDEGFNSANFGYKVKSDWLRFPDDLQSYDCDILNIDLDTISDYFEDDAAAHVKAYGKYHCI